jgi:hypothetical protein
VKQALSILGVAIASVALLASVLIMFEHPEPKVIIKEVPVEVIRERVVSPCEQHGLETTYAKEVKYFNGEIRIGIVCKKSG